MPYADPEKHREAQRRYRDDPVVRERERAYSAMYGHSYKGVVSKNRYENKRLLRKMQLRHQEVL